MAGTELRVTGEKPDEEFANLTGPRCHLSVTVHYLGIRLVERDQTLDVARVGTLYEKLLQVIWFVRSLVRQFGPPAQR